MKYVRATDDVKDMADRLRAKFSYDPTDGWLRRRTSYGKRCPAGAKVGYQSKIKHAEYWLVHFEGQNYLAHRLIWLYVHSEFPKDQLDHINRIKTDNRLSNLRACSGYENTLNQAARGEYKNVSRVRASGRWRVQMRSFGIYHDMGTFESKELAADFAWLARRHLHGEFVHD